eukprot:TRINITY_DN9645_c0_g1_i2.p1 TRINITY_DN9645_c0_g1~~TRINITY_DN9645_c0_g1_i2.p1  ORF type:complete len:221 (+),score=21.28 TRINITY_DN9645_c0_g1_i2:87-749(+)
MVFRALRVQSSGLSSLPSLLIPRPNPVLWKHSSSTNSVEVMKPLRLFSDSVTSTPASEKQGFLNRAEMLKYGKLKNLKVQKNWNAIEREWLEDFRNNSTLSEPAINIYAVALGVKKNIDEISKFWQYLIDGGTKLTKANYSCIIRMFTSNKMFNSGFAAVQHMQKNNIEYDSHLSVQMMELYTESREYQKAMEIFHEVVPGFASTSWRLVSPCEQSLCFG